MDPVSHGIVGRAVVAAAGRRLQGRGVGAAAILAASAFAAPLAPVWSLVQKEKSALLDTLKELVEIESGSSDREGLDRIADVIAGG